MKSILRNTCDYFSGIFSSKKEDELKIVVEINKNQEHKDIVKELIRIGFTWIAVRDGDTHIVINFNSKMAASIQSYDSICGEYKLTTLSDLKNME